MIAYSFIVRRNSRFLRHIVLGIGVRHSALVLVALVSLPASPSLLRAGQGENGHGNENRQRNEAVQEHRDELAAKADSDDRGHHSLAPICRVLPRLLTKRTAAQCWSPRAHNNGYSRQFPSEYRTIDGDGNNRANPAWGAAQIPFVRSIAPAYPDGLSQPSGDSRPSARLLSERLSAQENSIHNERDATDFVWQWGQFLDHDLDETPTADPSEPFPIAVPLGDPSFDPMGTGTRIIPLSRSAYVHDVTGVRRQVNALTAFIDGSQVYGSDEDRARALRSLDGSGRLKTTASPHGPLLPYNTAGFPNAGGSAASLFLAGDVRANEQVGLTAMHTLFVREHNHWAEHLKRMDPQLSDDDLYQMARVLVVAELQAITYREFLPVLLGHDALSPYRGYRKEVNPGISNLFATAAYRIGHSMLSDNLQRYERNGQPSPAGPLPLAKAFFDPSIVETGGIDVLLRGLASQPAQRIDTRIVSGVRNFLFGPPGAGGFDLAALNIQRGRDHGLPDYNSVRAAFGLSPLTSVYDIDAVEPELVRELDYLYGSPDQIDPWVGLLAEAHVEGAMVGETVRAVLADQFTRLRDGDRFWYQNYLHPNLRNLVERQSLAVIIRRNTGIGSEIQDQVFLKKPAPRPRENHPRQQSRSRSFTQAVHRTFGSSAKAASKAFVTSRALVRA